MNKMLKEEKDHLEYTKKVIESEIKKSVKSEQLIKKDSIGLSFEDRLRGTHLNLNSKLTDIGSRVAKLKMARTTPYFGRIDFQGLDSEQVLNIYIGKTAIRHNGTLVVYDWRSPICGLYYDSDVGPVTYNSLAGLNRGNLLLKRQLIVKNGELIDAMDSNLAFDDQLLIPYLSNFTDNGMKTILASIQKEQNAIIRLADDNIIVQGVAGSGKTSVALHRIAYLIYLAREKRISKKFLVIGPNNYFLNYISSVLPELEVTPVTQKTLLDIMNDYIDSDLSLNESSFLSSTKNISQIEEKLGKFKNSFEYCTLLDKFVKNCLEKNGIVKDDFKIDGKVVFSSEMIRERLLGDDGKHFELDRTRRYYKQLFREKKSSIYNQLNKEYKEMYISLPRTNPLRNEYIKKSIELKKMIDTQGEKLLDKYFKSIDRSSLYLYVSFISNLDGEETTLTSDEMKMLQISTLKAIKKKQVFFDDIAPLMYLEYKLTNKKINFDNVIIDEAQDYSIFSYYVLRKVFEHAKFNLYGDIAQAISHSANFSSWKELNEIVFGNECNLFHLNKSYRATFEITETANNILTSIGLDSAIPVLRHGTDISYFDAACGDSTDAKASKINEWLSAGYQTIAVICKDEIEAQQTQKELNDVGILSRYVSGDDVQYTNGVFVLDVMKSKGLEFDCAIINNASNDVYNTNCDLDMHLLYVAATRALHEQFIIYNKEIVKPFQSKKVLLK